MSEPAAAPKPRGQMIDIGGDVRLHLVRAGPADASGPTVLLEAGAFGFSADWAAVQEKLAARSVPSLAYDRAGLGFSDSGPAPRDGLAIAGDLERLLAAARETGPLVLCGHSMAGLHLRLFASRNASRIAGIVLVDATTPEAMDAPLTESLVGHFGAFSRLAAWGAEMGLFKPLAGALGDAIGLDGPAGDEKRWAFAQAGHNRWAAQEVLQWPATARSALAGGGDSRRRASPRRPQVVASGAGARLGSWPGRGGRRRFPRDRPQRRLRRRHRSRRRARSGRGPRDDPRSLNTSTPDRSNRRRGDSGVHEEMQAALVLEGVTKRYGAFTAVDDLTFEAGAGRIMGFLGPNGAGKTSTLRMALGLVAPTSGRISVLGHRDAAQVRERIGFLPEERGLYRRMTPVAVITFLAGLKGVAAPEARRRARALLESQGLGEAANRQIRSLSKGMAQKVQLLSAIAHEPDLVILDEPFSGLDPVNQQSLESLIRDLAARGTSVIFSTHVMQHAERLCDQVVLLARGKKVFDGTVEAARAAAPRALILEGPFDPAAMADLPGLGELSVERADGGGVRVTAALTAGAPAQEMLKAALAKGLEISRFELREPRLHDAFIVLTAAGATP